jgi:Site-specific recombinase XerD
MIKKYQTFEELTDTATAYLTGLCYSLSMVYYYQREWKYVGNYMKEREIKEYTSEVGSRYLNDVIGNVEYKLLPKSKQMRIRIVSSLSDFLVTGTIRKRKSYAKPEELDGEIGQVIAQYIIEATRLNGYAQSTIESHRLYLSRFLKYLREQNIHSFDSFTPQVIIHFCGSLNEYSVITRHLIILKTNQFLKYLYKRGTLPIDYSVIAPKDKYVRQAKLPSYFSPEEIDRLLSCIDRSNANGKRDYAMILLVAKLGLRCCDVVNMRFDSIQWEHEKLILIQQKTKMPLELPLFPDIGNAIINYLKAGRPQSNLPYVFLRLIPPYDNMDDNAVNGIMQKYLKLSGIQYDERRHGPHALRHSLAVSLLKQSIPLPVISSVLGHVNTESTLNYLRVNADSLRQCALEVSFNIQTGKEISI